MALNRSTRTTRASTAKNTRKSENVESPDFVTPHPLLIHHIVGEIFGYLPYRKLKNCRLVCETWNQVAKKHFEKKTLIVFDSTDRLTEFLDYYTEENPPIYKGYRFTNVIGPESNGFTTFIDRFGASHVRYVHFDRFEFVVENKCSMAHVFKQIDQMEEMVMDCRGVQLGPVVSDTETMEVFQCLHKLKVLGFAFNYVDEQRAERFAEILMKLFICSPRLEKVSTILKSDKRKRWNYPLQDFLPNPLNLLLPGFTRMENSLNADLIVALVIACSAPIIMKNFAHFELFLPLRLSLIEQMNTKKFSLKTLNLCIFNLHQEINQELIGALGTFLSHTCKTLETFKVSFGQGRDQLDMAEIGRYEFPVVKNLAIHGSTKLSHLNYISGCPSLETLHLVQCILPTNFTDFTISPPLAKLTSFIGHDIKIRGRRSCENILVSKIVIEFPHLRRLKLDHLKDSAFRVICKELNLLEELLILDSNVTDTGVTGISKPVLAKFGSKFGGNQPVFKKRLPYIGDLKKLRKLEIGSTGITDISVLYGIVDCITVRSLTIFSPKMTGKGLRCIVDKMNLLALRTVCCYSISDRVFEYARTQLGDPENVILNAEKGPKNSIEVGDIIKTCGLVHLEMPRK